jgi:UDP-2,3-diacylglucosamine pyrophosphatase LpxH
MLSDHPQRLLAYVVSDVHMNNHVYDASDGDGENPARRDFRRFLADLEAEVQPTDRLLLILNGDIFDLLGSWTGAVQPWDSEPAAVEAALLRVMREIIANNRHIMDAIGQLIRRPQVELIYVIGNHDHLLGAFPSAQELLRDALARDALSEVEETRGRIQFTGWYESVELGLYVEHGHRFDPFNHEAYQNRPPLGDMIVVLIVNRFAALAAEKLRTNGYSEDLVMEVQSRLQDAEYLRPISLGPYWLQALAGGYREHPENRGKAVSIPQIIGLVVAETLLEPEMRRLMAQRFHVPQALLGAALNLLLQHPALLPWLSVMVSGVLRKTESNRFQYQMAQAIRKQSGFHLITFGHTHIPSLIPLSERDFYFNTGCWKPIINLFRPQKSEPDMLEVLLPPTAPFNRIERSGVFRVERDYAHPARPNHFSLMTIQHGAS